MKRALIVDTLKEQRDLLTEHLSEVGLQCFVAEGARQALDFLEEKSPDLILVSDRLAGMPAFDFIRRAQWLVPKSRVVFISSRMDLPSDFDFALGTLHLMRPPLVLAQLTGLIFGTK